jgi:hypothetical protein
MLGLVTVKARRLGTFYHAALSSWVNIVDDLQAERRLCKSGPVDPIGSGQDERPGWNELSTFQPVHVALSS